MQNPKDNRQRIQPLWALLGCLLLIVSLPAPAACKLLQVAEWHVDLSQNRPFIDGAINDKPIRILIAIGSDRSFLRASEARKMGLPLRQYSDQKQYTTDGVFQVMTANVQKLQIGTFSMRNLALRVLDNKGGLEGIAFLLGADFFSSYDTEFDFAHGVVRLFQPSGCRPEQLVYWNDGYFITKLSTPSPSDPHIGIEVLLNGNSTHSWLSTSAPISTVGKFAAQNSGIKLGTESAPLLPESSQNTGAAPFWEAQFATLAIGNETIHNASLRVTDLFGQDSVQSTGSMLPHRMSGFADMLLGLDFLLAHRVMVLPKDHQMLFTYNGGPIFRTPVTGAALSASPPAPKTEP